MPTRFLIIALIILLTLAGVAGLVLQFDIGTSPTHPSRQPTLVSPTSNQLPNKAQQLPREEPAPEDPYEKMRVVVHRDLIPQLYASSNIGDLITGAVLLTSVRPEDAVEYTAEDFLKLALSLNPDDPLLMSVITLYCVEHQRLHEKYTSNNDSSLERFTETNLFCRNLPYLERLIQLGGDNAWTWALRASNEEAGSAAQIEMMERLGRAPFYNDYEEELSMLISSTLLEFGRGVDEQEDLLLYGIVEKNYRIRSQQISACQAPQLERHEQLTAPCLIYAEFLSESSTLLARMIGAAINADIQSSNQFGRHDPQLIAGVNHTVIAEFWTLVGSDSGAQNLLHRNMTRYTEIDAIKQSLIELGLIEDDGVPPQRTRPERTE